MQCDYILIAVFVSHCYETGRPVQAHGQTSSDPNAQHAQVLLSTKSPA